MSDGQRSDNPDGTGEVDEIVGSDELRPTVPIRQAGPGLAFLAVAALCAACIAIGFALGRTL